LGVHPEQVLDLDGVAGLLGDLSDNCVVRILGVFNLATRQGPVP
jgi:hypothetical protein